MEEISLLEKTKNLYKNRSKLQTIEEISKNTGLTKGWLGSFLHSENPGVQFVEILHNYLLEKKG